MQFYLSVLISISTLSLFSQQNLLSDLYNKSEYRQVIVKANENIRNNYHDFNSWYYKGLSENALYKFKEASQSFQRALELADEIEPILFLLAGSFEAEGDINSSINIYQELIKLDSNHVQAKSKLAMLYRNQKEYTKAVDLYTNLVQQDTTNGYFYAQLAFCCDKMGFKAPVISYYDKAIELNPNDSRSMHSLINEVISQKYYDIATNYIDTFLLSYPNDIYLLKQKAYVSALCGRYLDAVSEFRKVTEMGDSSLFTCKYYGQSLYNNGQFEESVYWLDKYIEKKPDDFQNQLILGLACQHDYQYRKSIKHLDAAQNLLFDQKMIARVFTEKAKTQIKYGDYKGFRDSTNTIARVEYKNANDNFLKALEVYQEGYEVYKELGTLYEDKLKDSKIALYYFEKYYDELDPNKINEYQLDWIQRKIESLKEKVHFIGE